MPLLEQVLGKYPREVKLVFKNFPLRSHPFAQRAALSALAAGRQGKFWEFHDRLFAELDKLKEEKFREIAQTLGLDMEKFEKDLADPALAQQISRDVDDAVGADVAATPTLFVNGRQVQDRSLPGISAMVDRELERSKKKTD